MLKAKIEWVRGRSRRLAAWQKDRTRRERRLSPNLLYASLPPAAMAAASLTLPVTFIQPGEASTGFEQQCSDAVATCITAWHSDNASGAALGCAEGSIFLLHPTEPGASYISLSSSPVPSSPALLPLPSPPLTDNSPRSSRLLNPFSISTRVAAAVSVSKEQAEAPKNYVDFDPEQEKLAALIQKPPTGAVASLRKQADTDEGPSSTRASSRAQSPAPTKSVLPTEIASPSSSTFPRLAPSARIYPRRVGHAVTTLHALEDASTLVALQTCGYVLRYCALCAHDF